MHRRQFTAGALEVAPILVGVVPFGLIAGIAAIEAGLEPLQAYSLSPIVFAGASQLAIVDLLARDAAPFVVVATALVINARMAMYSASLAPFFRELGPVRKAFGAYVLTDQSYAVSIFRFSREEETLNARFSFYLGASLALWLVWQVSSIIGVVVGAGIPPEWSLDFAIPLVFIALLVPAITDRGTTIAAVAAGVAAVALAGMPLNLGLLSGAAIGLTIGVVGERT